MPSEIPSGKTLILWSLVGIVFMPLRATNLHTLEHTLKSKMILTASQASAQVWPECSFLVTNKWFYLVPLWEQKASNLTSKNPFPVHTSLKASLNSPPGAIPSCSVMWAETFRSSICINPDMTPFWRKKGEKHWKKKIQQAVWISMKKNALLRIMKKPLMILVKKLHWSYLLEPIHWSIQLFDFSFYQLWSSFSLQRAAEVFSLSAKTYGRVKKRKEGSQTYISL